MQDPIETFSGISIFRPRDDAQKLWVEKSRRHLLAKYKVGMYTNGSKINEILQFQFQYFAQELEKRLDQILYGDFIRFFLFQYDRAARIDSLYRANKLPPNERQLWSEIGPTFRRALKYLVEQIIITAKQGLPVAKGMAVERFTKLLEETLICAEYMVRHYIESDQTYLLFPDQTVLEITQDPSVYPTHLSLDDPCLQEYAARQDEWMKYKSKHEIDLSNLESIKEQNTILGPAFLSSHNVSYRDAVSVIGHIIKHTPAPNRENIPALNLHNLIDVTATDFRLSQNTVRTIIDGFSISSEKMLQENRVLWNPRQEYRAFRRGFFEFTDPAYGTYLTFSREMAIECLIQLTGRIGFQQYPPEWATPTIDRAIAELSNNNGKWFESLIHDHMSKLGWTGIRSVKEGIGLGAQRLLIPSEVGELDYLGYSAQENLLILLECKLVSFTFEPKYFQSDISKFLEGSDAFFAKFQKKINWVTQNVPVICKALSTLSEFDDISRPSGVASAIVTLYPTMASCFASSFPCVTLKDLHVGYEQKGAWPFQSGIYHT